MAQVWWLYDTSSTAARKKAWFENY